MASRRLWSNGQNSRAHEVLRPYVQLHSRPLESNADPMSISTLLAAVAITLAATSSQLSELPGIAHDDPSGPRVVGMQGHDPHDSIGWFRSYSRARAQARITKKPILLEFRCQP